MDEGDILLAKRFPLAGDETARSLTEYVAGEAALLAIEGLNRIMEGTALFTPQTGRATYTPLLTLDHAPLDFSKDARSLHARIRALNPWPKARCTYEGQSLIISGVWGRVNELGFEVVEPGRVLGFDKEKGIGIGTGLGVLWVTTLQLEKERKWIGVRSSMAISVLSVRDWSRYETICRSSEHRVFVDFVAFR